MAVYSEVSAGEVVAKAINMHQDVAQFLALQASAVRALGSLRQAACLPAGAAVKRFGASRIFVDGQAGAD